MTDTQLPEISSEFVDANGLRFEVLTCGEGDTLALCLHGFPEVALSWRDQMIVLARMGYRVWAPNQRGYGLSSRPRRMQDYAMENLIADLAGLIDASGASRVVLLGHDWGAMVAWCFAIRHLRAIERLVIFNVPHPACFVRALERPGQLLKSWYVAAFQIPFLPDWLMARNDGDAVGNAVLKTCTSAATFPPDLLAAICANAAQPHATTAMLNWYRAWVIGGGMLRQVRAGFPTIDVPTLMLWGENDKFLEKYTTDDTSEFVPNVTIKFLPGVSHWIQQDAPERCNEELQSFLAL
jgi:pimeloyl-ACP methyl ester carboxylesterase